MHAIHQRPARREPPDPADPADPNTTAARATGTGRPTDLRRKLGRLGEGLAAAHLERLGYALLARNVRTRYGEIDLIAIRDGVLVIAEVKTRRTSSPGGSIHSWEEPLLRLTHRQRARLRRLTLAWLTDHRPKRPGAHTIRFDAIGVIVDRRHRLLRLDHIEGAW